MAMLSPFIHLLQQRSFRRSGTETCAGRSATPRKLSSLAAHLFDARRTLPPHSCQVPQCWAVGRTNGMKRSFFGAVAAARGRTEHSCLRLFGVRRSTVSTTREHAMDKQREQSRSSPKKTGSGTAHTQRHHGDEARGRRWAGTRGREAAGKRLGLTSGPLPRRRPFSS